LALPIHRRLNALRPDLSRGWNRLWLAQSDLDAVATDRMPSPVSFHRST